jgi:homoaconitase/3-isopropylmalate dehydratase large subunit
MIHIAGLLGMDGGTYRSVEFGGEYIDNLPMHERIIFPNMSTEIGAKCGLIAADDVTIQYLENETPANGPFEMIVPVNPRYERLLEIDVSTLSPQVACHPDVDNVKPLSQVEGLEVNEVYIGTCTNARYEDIEIVANMLKGKKVNPTTRVIVTPASERIYKKAMQNGLDRNLDGCGLHGHWQWMRRMHWASRRHPRSRRTRTDHHEPQLHRAHGQPAFGNLSRKSRHRRGNGIDGKDHGPA